jgi:hypothetical protein
MNTIAASSSANRCGSAQFRGEEGSFILGEHIRNCVVEQRQSFCRALPLWPILAEQDSLAGFSWTGLDWYDSVGLGWTGSDWVDSACFPCLAQNAEYSMKKRVELTEIIMEMKLCFYSNLVKLGQIGSKCANSP